MSAKTANIMARVEPEIKEQAESIMEQLGLSASGVINMLYRQIILRRGLPFAVTIPTAPPGLFLINWRFSDDNQKNAAHFGRRVKHFLIFFCYG